MNRLKDARLREKFDQSTSRGRNSKVNLLTQSVADIANFTPVNEILPKKRIISRGVAPALIKRNTRLRSSISPPLTDPPKR